ncbi:IQ calmodulin-binding motif-containing protein 1 isoform X1 [Oryzias latipes]|uniref:IQ motif containing B1 n=2 Tax=Oryzias latipes TaxID=8090 RepID=H2L7I8_ORYLA|nr:IQ calmodulin-binding motif-containing protein 1 isoform X1 [Oryzias latipes]XP_023820118.1 IQ calmodulin-binding motif-containing protein 1 isoform X1 [Oryzias latipes]
MVVIEEEEALVSELQNQLQKEDLNPQEKIRLLNDGLSNALNLASVQPHNDGLTRVKSRLYHSGILSQCALTLSLPPSRLRGSWSAAATLAHLTSSCCVGVEPGRRSEAFHQLLLPSVMDGLLSLASLLMSHAEHVSHFKKVMDSVGWLVSAHTHLTSQVLSSIHYEQIQMCEDASVCLLCMQLWIQICTVSRGFLPSLTDDSILLLLNEAVGQLAVMSDTAVGGASIKLILLMASQLGFRFRPLLMSFKGLDSLLLKDWRGRGFDQDIDQLIEVIQSEKDARKSQVSSERERAACLIQAAWRSYRTRRRVKSLNRAVSALQRRYRAQRRQQQQQKEAKQWEEELKYQVCLRRQRARREFHQKQRRLLQLLPPDQVQAYLQECERRAAVKIQSFWRGVRDRRHYHNTVRKALKERRMRQQAARTLQRAVRRFLEKRRMAKARPLDLLWIGQKGLTDSRRAELKQQVEEYITVHKSSRVSPEECASLHEEAQLLLQAELQKGAQQRREEQRVEALLAHTRTQLELLRDAPPLGAVTETMAQTFLTPAAALAARARNAHNARLQADRLPWWKTLGEARTFGSAHLQELEAELEAKLGGLYIGGSAVVRTQTEVEKVKLLPEERGAAT